eukprot:scpid97100/ scgid25875/ 
MMHTITTVQSNPERTCICICDTQRYDKIMCSICTHILVARCSLVPSALWCPLHIHCDIRGQGECGVSGCILQDRAPVMLPSTRPSGVLTVIDRVCWVHLLAGLDMHQWSSASSC